MKNGILNFLIVGTGGFLGSIGRYLLSGAVYKIFSESSFPHGTVVVNILGCFLIGFISGLVELRQLLSPEARLFVLIGFLGGFTTFSTFGYETISLLKNGEFFFASINILIQVIAGLTAVWLGYSLTRYF